jgi:hypothetical protein
MSESSIQFFSDENLISATHYGLKGLPLELVTVTFEEFEGGTKMSLSHIGVP